MAIRKYGEGQVIPADQATGRTAAASEVEADDDRAREERARGLAEENKRSDG